MAKAKMTLDDILSKASGNGTPSEKAFDEEFQHRYPAVHLLMTEIEKAKGKPRQTACATIFVENGCFSVVLNERDRKLKIFAGGATIDEMWATLEERITSPDADWTKDSGRKR